MKWYVSFSRTSAPKDFVAYKGKKIASISNNYKFIVKNALNVGCGGAVRKSVSEPYFDEEYEMIGVDISEEYLEQFNQVRLLWWISDDFRYR